MVASPVIAVVIFLLVGGARPSAVPAAAPILILWAAAPAVAYWLSRPVPVRRRIASERRGPAPSSEHRPKDLALLRDLHGSGGQRPPAGQLSGSPRAGRGAPDLAHQHRDGPALHPRRARPGLHPYSRAGGELEALLDTTEGLERHEGHLLNWYDTRTLAPCCRDTCPPWTAAILPELCLPSRKA